MAQKRVQRPIRKMKPLYIVFCEGETEENYVALLRKLYRVPVKVVSKITGQKISQALIERHELSERIAKDDIITSFVMYDLDVPDVAVQLLKCNAIQLTSNPCIEFWFLLHECEQRAAISTTACLTKLKKVSLDWHNYEKGTLTVNQQNILYDKKLVACDRAKRLSATENPSSSVYHLINKLEEVLIKS